MSRKITNAISSRHWTSQPANKAKGCQFSWPMPYESCSDFISQVLIWIGFRFFFKFIFWGAGMLTKCAVLYESMDEMWKMSLMHPSCNWKVIFGPSVLVHIIRQTHRQPFSFAQTDRIDVQEPQKFPWQIRRIYCCTSKFELICLMFKIKGGRLNQNLDNYVMVTE